MEHLSLYTIEYDDRKIHKYPFLKCTSFLCTAKLSYLFEKEVNLFLEILLKVCRYF